MKELAPPTVNLKKLHETETLCTEPILVIISPGADPSQELEELATQVVGADKYHQVGTLELIKSNTPKVFSLRLV